MIYWQHERDFRLSPQESNFSTEIKKRTRHQNAIDYYGFHPSVFLKLKLSPYFSVWFIII